MLELNGFKYSKNEFEDYKIRVQVEIRTVKDKFIFNIYSTDTDLTKIEEILLDRKSDEVVSLDIIFTATKEEDKARTEFLLDWI